MKIFKKGVSVRIGLLSIVVGLSLTLLSLPSLANVCQTKLKPLEGEWEDHREDEFIIQYAIAGKHALQETQDTAASGLPDVIADAATQLVAMREMLKLLGFQQPLESPRYLTQGASHILVRFREMEKSNGRAFDEVRRLPSGECVLIIEVTSRYRSGNFTPAHELFHQIQNGYTTFKQPWFYEGTARWSESVLGKQRVFARPYPMSEPDLRHFFTQSYAAASGWYGLIKRCDKNPVKVEIPASLDNLKYRDGRPVIADSDIQGHALIREVLEGLGKLADQVSQDEGVNRYRWPEKMQRDTRFNNEMWRVVSQTGECSHTSATLKELESQGPG